MSPYPISNLAALVGVNKLALLTSLLLHMLASSVMAQSCYLTSIQEPSPFLGNGNEIMLMADGTTWKNNSLKYLYLYAYYPQVTICPSSGRMYVGNHDFSISLISRGVTNSTCDQVYSDLATCNDGWTNTYQAYKLCEEDLATCNDGWTNTYQAYKLCEEDRNYSNSGWAATSADLQACLDERSSEVSTLNIEQSALQLKVTQLTRKLKRLKKALSKKKCS